MMKSDPYEEGRIAAANGFHCTECPYAFHRMNVSYTEFDEKIRPLFDEWWRGWSARLRENNLNFKFRPIKKTKLQQAKGEA